MKLFVAEKPSLGRTVANVLGKGRRIDGGIAGDGWTMTWCFGHLYEPFNPEDYNESWGRWNVNDLPLVPDQWRLRPRPDTKKQITIIQSLLKQASCVVNVGDPDREGQLLVDELLAECGWRGTTLRLWLPDLTDKGIKQSLQSMSDNSDYQGLYNAAIARQRADWLVGMNLTRSYTLNARKAGHEGVLSVGRVQTPTLALVVDRDLSIANFKSVDFYEISATFQHADGEYVGKMVFDDDITDDDNRLLDRDKADDLLARALSSSDYRIADLLTKRKTNHPPLCFSLTDLQAAASKQYGMSAGQVLDIAQALYETHKVTSYPRSDSGYLAENQFAEAPAIATALSTDDELASVVAAADLSLKSKAWSDKKSSIAAHTAIIPTGDTKALPNLNDDELAIFRMIAIRYLSQFYPPNVIEQTTFNSTASDVSFRSSGNVTIEIGWKGISHIADDEDQDTPLIVVAEGDNVSLRDSQIVTKATTPPKHFTDGTLVVAMKNIAKYIEEQGAKTILKGVEGIGTSATRAPIIENLKKRGFLTNKGKSLLSTPPARKFCSLLPEDIKSAVKTAEWERKLSDIEDGNLSPDEFMVAQVDYVNSILSDTQDLQIETYEDAIKCPACEEGVLRRRKGKFGLFWGCSRYSDGCKAIFKDNRGKPVLEKTAPKSFPEKPCPHIECDGTAKQFTKKKGRGKFWICNTCEAAGRNKFLSDVHGSPAVQE